ncbi:MAG: efflux RND transporter permease subunit [Gammaproteobacteria bacterium]|nr:efflux RND transporter permease subunit [Gammaproteobacteria bacterium]MDH4254294.1 efflux RND transporter permease subunit [Gammaproteobacteria bacterium]MDH5309147.1 efflux RND transporter permease subunit [Gammaproteobacteria bacterium]
MLISDLSVRRPVFAAVISLILVIVGLMAATTMPMREYPDVQQPIVSIDTRYRGAASDIVERRVTQIIEDQVAGISGIEKMSSASYDERSSITLEFSSDRDIDGAANDVRDRVSRILNNLPDEADPPEVSKRDSSAATTMWIDLSSDQRSLMELSDYAQRYIVDALSIVEGVAFVRASGERRKAMRIWVDTKRLAARGLTVGDIEDALRRENVQIPSGRLESSAREFTLRTDTGMTTEEDFRQLVLARGAGDYLVRLGEVADVEIAPEDDRSFSRTNGISGTSLGIIPQAQANILQVNRDVARRIDELQSTLPPDVSLSVNVDNAIFIAASLKEVAKALGLALLLVFIVIYCFIGTIRATFIPAITIPISIIASFVVMAALGFSINTLTLLGFVLAIGLVVDDAIVVLENIVRRIEKKEPVLLAATNGSREIGFAVIATTLVLVAVILPVSFMPGNVGRIFGEFGISLAAAVCFSSLIALTLVPMLSSKLFATGLHRGHVTHWIDSIFRVLASAYERLVRRVIGHPWLVIGGTLLVFGGSLTLLGKLPVEYMPREDRAFVMVNITAPDGASLDYTRKYVEEVEAIMAADVESGDALRVMARSGSFRAGGDVNTAMVFAPLAPWDERERDAEEIVQSWNRQLRDLPGVSAFAFAPGSWSIGQSSRPLQIVLGGTDYEELARWRDIVIAEAEKLPGLSNLQSDYNERKPKIDVSIDRDRAADLGVSLGNVGRTLESILGSRVATTFIERGEEYRVILQGADERRQTPSDLDTIYVRSDRSGQLIPLSNLVKLTEVAGPVDLRRFDRMRAITISASLGEGYSLGQAVADMEDIIREHLPEAARINYDGESRDLKTTGNAIYLTFLLALVIAYLVLAAQFESFKHPLIIMTTVPLAIAGGLIGLYVFGASINVFSQIGAVMLIGLAAKNGILIVEFANQLRDRGAEFREAVIESSVTRLRPVLMTSLCTAFGAMPLVMASGAGAMSRQSIGAVVFFGVTFSMVLTLVLVPTVYALIARKSHSPEYIGQMIDRLTARAAAEGGTAATSP